MLNLKQLDTPSLIKWVILAVLTAFSCYVTFPAKEKVRLGLDLQGGTSFTVQIDEAKLIEDLKAQGFATAGKTPETATPEEAARIDAQAKKDAEAAMSEADDLTLEVLRKRIDAIGTNEPIIAKADGHRILIQIPGADAAKAKAAEESVKSAAFLAFRLVHRDNDRLSRAVLDGDRTPEGFVRGTTTAGRTCFVRADDYAERSAAPDFMVKLGRFAAPSALYECVMEEVGRDAAGRMGYVPMFVSRSPEVTVKGSTVTRATPNRNAMTGETVVDVEFDADGTRDFARITGRYVGRQLAIVLDDVVRSAPVLKSEISDGRCEISGSFTWKSATELAGVLNAGALKAPIRIIEQRTVSPSLGQEAISKGTLASIVGVAAVFIFMLFYYLFCGIIADVALALNVILWPAGMIIASGIMSVFISDGTGSSSIGQLPVLTLPGIAGLVLSVGMAVDANVLIFERMREEFRLGKTAKAAVAAGYDRAFLAIFDSNLTTLFTGVILFIFGSGPIRGFAVTLCGGIIISMFTALVVTRLIFNLIVQDTTKPYKMLQWVPETVNFDFLKWAKPLSIAAVAVIVVTVGLFLFRATSNPSSVMAVDFTGGLSLRYEASLKSDGSNVALDPDKVRAVVDAIEGISDPTVQNITAEGEKTQTLVKTAVTEVTVTNEKGEQEVIASEEAIRRAIDDATPEYNVAMISRDQVGSQIGEELKSDAVWSIILSLIMIIVYVSFRFQFGFALGGVVALAHDALITLGIFTLCGNQVSLTTVAALLTIVGYSINDTIVAFDRVREIMAREPNLDFPTAIRKGLNQTLSRTLLTTLSTLMPVAALYFFGGAAMHDFAFALFVGMVAGTYSTLFIAPLVTVAWYRGKRPLTAEQRAAARAAKMAEQP